MRDRYCGGTQDFTAEDYSAKKHSVTKPQVDQLDADVLLIHFPDDLEMAEQGVF